MPFHSTQATSHALQPMHVVTSMYLQTSSSRWTPRPGTVPECPEMALICRTPVGMCLNFLHLDQESLELRRIRVRVDDRRRQQVGGIEARPPGIFRDAAVAPVNRDADLVRLLSVDEHRPDPFR